MPRTNEPGRSVSSRLLEILFAFQPRHPRLTIAQLTRITGIPHATARRLVMELVDAGALERAEDGSLTVGIRIWQLGTLAPLTMPLRTAALPFIDDLHAAIREHVQLAVLEDGEALIVERISTHHAVSLISHVGGHLPLHSSGVGKVLLAHGDRDLLDEVIGRGLERYTARTITDPARLSRAMAECRQTGVAVVREETSPGADSVATRIMNADGKVVAALSVVVNARSVDLRTVIRSVIVSGLGISRRLGWSPQVGVR